MIVCDHPSSVSSSTPIIMNHHHHHHQRRIRFYVIQRCWYSGPYSQDVAPIDYLRLFTSREDAEQVAYMSATMWSGLSSLYITSVPVRNPPDDWDDEDDHHHHHHTTTTTGYAVCGSLFWVRRVWGTVVTSDSLLHAHSNTSVPPSTTASVVPDDTGNDTDHNNNGAYTHAFAILTEGVLGGTGNRNSRRGVEINHGRIVLSGCNHNINNNSSSNSSNNSHLARSVALQIFHQLQQSSQQSQIHPPHHQVLILPIGTPMESKHRNNNKHNNNNHNNNNISQRLIAQEWYSNQQCIAVAAAATSSNGFSSSLSSSLKRSNDDDVTTLMDHEDDDDDDDMKDGMETTTTCTTNDPHYSFQHRLSMLQPHQQLRSKRPRRCCANEETKPTLTTPMTTTSISK